MVTLTLVSIWLILRGQDRPTTASYLADGGGRDDAVMEMVRGWCRAQGDDRRALEGKSSQASFPILWSCLIAQTH